MQIGFYTTGLGEQPIEEVAFWAAEAGFDTLEVDVTRHVGDPTRVCQVVEMVRRAGVDAALVDDVVVGCVSQTGEQSINVALQIAERAVFMEKGEVRFDGPAAELLQRPDVVRSVFLSGSHKPVPCSPLLLQQFNGCA